MTEESRPQPPSSSEPPFGEDALFQVAELAAIYHSAPVGLCVLDRELRFVRINDKLATVNGLPAAAHIGRTVREVVPDLADLAEPLLRQVLETGEAIHNVEISGETAAAPGVSRTWLEHYVPLRDDEGRIVGVNVTAEEITRLKGVEEQLRNRQVQLEMALDGARLGLWWNNLLSGETYWDARTRQIFGVDAETPASAETGFRLIHPDDRERARRAFTRATEAGSEGYYEEEKRIIRPDGSIRWIATKGKTQFAGEGAERKPICLTGVVMDITAEKEAATLLERRVEERTTQVRQLATELARAEQRERRRLAQVLHDEVQQMLVALQLKIHLGQDSNEDPRRYAEELEQDVAAIQEVTRTLTSSLTPPGAVSNRLAEALSWVTSLMRERYGLRVELEIDEEQQLADQDLREMVVSMVRELLFNVVKHAGIKEARLRVEEAEEKLLIHVQDEGQGFDVSTLRAQQSGFGLYSIGERMALFGGRMEVAAEEGRGTRVTLIIPTAWEPANRAHL